MADFSKIFKAAAKIGDVAKPSYSLQVVWLIFFHEQLAQLLLPQLLSIWQESLRIISSPALVLHENFFTVFFQWRHLFLIMPTDIAH